MKAIEPQWLLDFMRRGEKTPPHWVVWGGQPTFPSVLRKFQKA